MKTLIIFILLCASCVIGIGASQPQPNNWEYKFVYECSEKKANSLGLEGWELAAIQSTGPGIGNNVPSYVFKRAK